MNDERLIMEVRARGESGATIVRGEGQFERGQACLISVQGDHVSYRPLIHSGAK